MILSALRVLLLKHARCLPFCARVHARQLPEQAQLGRMYDAYTFGEALQHVAWCITQIPKLPEHKQQRWLGFVQGALWMGGLVPLSELRRLTRVAEDTSAQTPEDCEAQRRARGIAPEDDALAHELVHWANDRIAAQAYARAKQDARYNAPERCAAQHARQDAWDAEHPEGTS